MAHFTKNFILLHCVHLSIKKQEKYMSDKNFLSYLFIFSRLKSIWIHWRIIS